MQPIPAPSPRPPPATQSSHLAHVLFLLMLAHYCHTLPGLSPPGPHLLLLQGLADEDIAAELAPSPDDPAPLTVEEEEERRALLAEGFGNWNRCGASCVCWGQGQGGVCAG